MWISRPKSMHYIFFTLPKDDTISSGKTPSTKCLILGGACIELKNWFLFLTDNSEKNVQQHKSAECIAFSPQAFSLFHSTSEHLPLVVFYHFLETTK